MKISRESLEIQKLSLVQKRCICFLVQTKSTWKCGPISVEIRMIISRQFHTRKSSCHFSKNHIILHLYLYVCMYVQLDWTPNRCTQKRICQRTVRATTIPRPPLENSRWGEFVSALTIFVKSIFYLLFFERSENRVPTKIVKTDLDSPRRIL